MRANRCKKCNKIIRSENKRGYCCGCSGNQMKKENKLKKCHICGEECKCDMRIQIRINSVKGFCTRHFNKLLTPEFNDPVKLRAEIKRLQSYH